MMLDSTFPSDRSPLAIGACLRISRGNRILYRYAFDAARDADQIIVFCQKGTRKPLRLSWASRTVSQSRLPSYIDTVILRVNLVDSEVIEARAAPESKEEGVLDVHQVLSQPIELPQGWDMAVAGEVGQWSDQQLC